MAGQRLDLLHSRVLPHADLVEREPVRAHDLVRGLREHQVAHLRSRVDRVQRLQRVRVPEANVSVRSATAGR